MQEFEHLILTRFNVKVNYSNSKTGLDPEWLKHRFKLFEKFCYPSVYGQSNQNFKWLVFFDNETPENFKEKINDFSKWKAFIPVYVEGELTEQGIRETVLHYLNHETRYLITTRLDNDDAICNNFIANVQENFEKQESEFISFTHGYVLHDQKLYCFKYLKNPFVNLIEKINEWTTDGFKTVLCVSHTELASVGNIKQVKTQPGWLQVIHERNVSNRVRGVRYQVNKLHSDFSVNLEDVPVQDKSISYWKDWIFSVLKLPLESVILSLPTDTRAFIRKLIFQVINKETG